MTASSGGSIPYSIRCSCTRILMVCIPQIPAADMHAFPAPSADALLQRLGVYKVSTNYHSAWTKQGAFNTAEDAAASTAGNMHRQKPSAPPPPPPKKKGHTAAGWLTVPAKAHSPNRHSLFHGCHQPRCFAALVVTVSLGWSGAQPGGGWCPAKEQQAACLKAA